MNRPFRLFLEPLEDRSVPATFGVPWSDAEHLTLSFVPDGTRIAGHASSLFQTLSARMPTAVWQREILRAFQTWAVQANLSSGVVPDSGSPFGVPGEVQHDPRFGDLRIGAQAMSREAVSIAVPPDPFLSGTWAGDVLLNSTYAFDGRDADIYSVFLHEFGHALGLDHSTDPNSVMFSHAALTRTGLSAGDIAALRALYGARAPDLNEGAKGNDTLRNATRIKYSENSDGYNGSTPLLSFGDVTTTRDADLFYLRPLTGYRGPVTFRLQTAGISLLAPRLTILDAAGRVLGQRQSVDPRGGVVTVTLPQVNPQAVYYAKVEGAVRDVFGVGRYGLATTFDARLTVPVGVIEAAWREPLEMLPQDDVDEVFRRPEDALFNDDLHTDDDFLTAGNLKATPGYPAQTHYKVVASVGDAVDADFYRIKSPRAQTGQATVLTVALTSLNINGILPRPFVFDGSMNPVAVQTLANGNGSWTVQAANLRGNTSYFVKVVAPGTTPADAGNYSLTAKFGRQTASLTTFAQGELTRTATQRSWRLFVAQSQLFHFVLSAHGAANSAVRMTITDRNGIVVFNLAAPSGEAVSGSSLFLAPGEYTLHFTAEPSGGLLTPLVFSLSGANLSNPVGPALEDPTLTPLFTNPTGALPFSYPGGTASRNPFHLIELLL